MHANYVRDYHNERQNAACPEHTPDRNRPPQTSVIADRIDRQLDVEGSMVRADLARLWRLYQISARQNELETLDR